MWDSNIEPEPLLVGYARVSTAEQSLDMQIAALEKFGVEPGRIWSEKRSATSQKRPQTEQCLNFMTSGDTLVVWKLDRFARSTLDLLTRLEKLEARGIKFVSLTEKIETTTPGGRLLVGVLALLAQFERDLVSERTASGMKAKREREPDWVPGPTRKLTGAALKRAQVMREAGKTAPQIIDALQAEFKIKVSARTIYLRTKP